MILPEEVFVQKIACLPFPQFMIESPSLRRFQHFIAGVFPPGLNEFNLLVNQGLPNLLVLKQ